MFDTSRNWLFISKEDQQKIKTARLVIIGCGIGSVTAELAVRTGFENLLIVDGDTVDLSNLNRQNYVSGDVGESKSLTLKKRLLSINPNLNLTVENKFWNESDIKANIKQGDIVVNAIDFDAQEFMAVNETCLKVGATELFPINSGFGSIIFCFNSNTDGWYSVFSKDNLKAQILQKVVMSIPPCYLHEAFQRYPTEHPGYDPQTGMAVYCSAVLSVSMAIKAATGQPVPAFPDFLMLDPLLQAPTKMSGTK
jgi:molybdopterin/thiamine biosynthesis adenylyltransferase